MKIKAASSLIVALAIATILVAREARAQVAPYPTPNIDLTSNLGIAGGGGGGSGTPTATPLPCECGPGDTFELRHLDSTTIQIAVTWDKVSGATGYTVLRCDQTLSGIRSVSRVSS